MKNIADHFIHGIVLFEQQREEGRLIFVFDTLKLQLVALSVESIEQKAEILEVILQQKIEATAVYVKKICAEENCGSAGDNGGGEKISLFDARSVTLFVSHSNKDCKTYT